MRPQKVNDQQLITGLMEVIRAKGYEGASMNDLAEATGLKKASLYHRFPGGKQEITEAVLRFTQQWGKEHVHGTLYETKLSPEQRLRQVLQNIKGLYRDGDAICVLRALTMDPSLPVFSAQIQKNLHVWMEGFTKLGLDFGLDQKQAATKARQTLVLIQGSLVVAKGMNDLSIFQQSLKDVEGLYV